MQNVVITYGLTQAPPSLPTRRAYREAYEHFYTLAYENGLALSRTSLAQFDFERGLFSNALAFEPDRGWHTISDIRPALIEDRSRFTEENHAFRVRLAERIPMINTPEFTRIANSKFETSARLPQHFKLYSRISSNEELDHFFDTTRGRVFVLKPEFGSGGKGVLIGTPEELRSLEISYPILAQEFIDSSHGIPGITNGYHDLRLVFINDALIYSYVRIPRKGSLLANIAQGGSMFIVKPSALPHSLKPVITDVQRVFAQFPQKIYTIDLMFDEQGKPWIVELNTMPGIYFAAGQEEARDTFYRALIKALKSAAELGSSAFSF